MSTPFYKLSGAGNDFIVLVEPESEPTPENVRRWCRRGVSLGADGVFTLRREDVADGDVGVRMIHYNPDGSRAELCLNGSRCAVRTALELDWAKERLTLLTDAGALAAEPRGDDVALALPDFVGEPRATALMVEGVEYSGWFVRVGVPHFVLPWSDDLAEAPVDDLGRKIRLHPDLAPDGANVHFVSLSEEEHQIRSFERGVEAETLACGTGVVATAATARRQGRSLPFTARTKGGFVLSVEERADGLTLIGEARIVARGELF